MLSSIAFLFYPKNFPVLNDYKYTHNMMQPPLCLKIWRVVLSNVLYWICLKHNTLYLGQNIYCFGTFFSVLLQCLVSNRKHVSECFYSVQASFYSIRHLYYYCGVTTMMLIHPQLVLWSNYNVVDPSSVFSCHSH